MVSMLQNTLEFLKDFGFFDVVIPFLLFFVIIFAILEKSKILGKDKSNVNLIVALSVAFLTVATNKVVSLITQVLPNMILILVLLVMFVMILGLFFKEEELEFSEKHKGWFKFFMFMVFLFMIIFVLQAIPADGGTMLENLIGGIVSGSSSELVGGIILLAVMIGVISLVVKSKSSANENDAE